MAAQHASARAGLAERFRVMPGSKVDLRHIDAAATHGFDKASAESKMSSDLVRLASLQERIYAEGSHRILIVLQGIDAAGKDGTISHVMSAFNPQGVRVIGFGVPSKVELAHDYLWRMHAVTPGAGEIAIFNRSHYESVLVERVDALVPEAAWSKRYHQINEWERILVEEGTTIVKFFLHISPEEQRKRLQARYDDPTKRWKFKLGDLTERAKWDAYQAAFKDALERCSTEAARWYCIPADHKWFRDLAIGEILADVLDGLKPVYPPGEVLPPGQSIV
jgi:PPK2 family polyphosphate:nucleotide phosphotransferase